MATGRKSVSAEYLSRTNWLLTIVGLLLVILFLMVLCSRQKTEVEVFDDDKKLEFRDDPTIDDDASQVNLLGGTSRQVELFVQPSKVTFSQVKLGSLAEAVITLQAKGGPIKFEDVPRLVKTQNEGFELSGNCFSKVELEENDACRIDVKWEPTTLLNYKNQIRVAWRVNRADVFDKQDTYIDISGRSSDAKDCVVCEQKNIDESVPQIAVGPGGAEYPIPPDSPPGVITEDGKIIAVVEPNKVPVGLNNRVLGSIEKGTKKVIDADGKKIGTVLGDNTIVDTNFNVIGAALYVDVAVIDGQGKVIGTTKFDENGFRVVDSKGQGIGIPRVDTSVVDYDGRQIGMIIPWGTALDLNGKVLGVVLEKTAEVLSDDQVRVGHLQQNGMVTNEQGELIGAMTPHGVGVSTGCRSFGRVTYSSEVKDAYGQLVGRALLDNAIVDSEMNEVGKVIPQGIIINASGRVQGFMNADGKAVDKTGSAIGCAGPDGMVQAGKKMVGGVMKKGKVVGRSCEVIGSVYPNGVVMNQSVEPVGYVRPDGYVVNSSQDVIGAVVPFGTAIAEGCRMLGMISVTGQVIDTKGVSVGCVTDNKNVINQNGKEIGQITPQGAIFQQGALLGRVRLDGYIVNKNGKIVDCVLNKYKRIPGTVEEGGVVLDDNGLPTGWTHMDGKCYSESNEILGNVAFNGWVSNEQGRLIGFVAPSGVIVSNEGNILGSYSALMGTAVNPAGEDFARIMPDLTVLDKAGENVLGTLIPMNSAGVALDSTLLGHMEASGFLTEDNNLQARVLADKSVVDASNRVVGNILPVGQVLSALGKPVGWANVNGEVLSKGTRIGQVAGNGLAISPDGRVLGRVWMPISILVNGSGVMGSVIPKPIVVNSEEQYQLGAYDKNGTYIGVVSPFGAVFGTGGRVIGKAVPVGLVFNFTNNLLGWVSFTGNVVDKSGRVLGTPTQNGLVLDSEGKAIGFVLEKGSVIDKNGVMLGNIAPDGSVLQSSGKSVGFATASPFIVHEEQGIIGRRWPLGIGVDPYGTVLGWLNPAGVVVQKQSEKGRIALDGRILDASYNLVGSFVPLGADALTGSESNTGVVTEDASVQSGSGKVLGTVMGPDYVIRNGELVARLMQNSLFVNDEASTKTLGQAEYSSNVYRIGTMRPIGGLMTNGLMADGGANVVGGVVPMGLPQTVNLKLAGSEIFNGVIMLGGKIYGGTTASGITMVQDDISGQVTPLTTVIDKNGLLVGVSDGAGGIVNRSGAKIASQMAFGSALSSETEWVGGALKAGFVIDDYAKKLGAVTADGSVIGSKNVFKGRVLPDGSLAGVPDEKVYNSMPYIGHTVTQGIPAGYNNTVLGRTTVMGDVVDASDKKVYSLLDDGSVLGTKWPLEGRVLPFGSAVGFKGVLGFMDGSQRIVNSRGEDLGYMDHSGYVLARPSDESAWNKGENLQVLGVLVPEQLMVNNACQVIGQTTHTGEVIDGLGNTVGRLYPQGREVRDMTGKTLGHIVRYGPVMTFAQKDPEKVEDQADDGASQALAPYRGIRYLGRVLPNGMAVDEAGVVIGCVGLDGVLLDTSGQKLGGVVERGPVFGSKDTENAKKMIGRVDAHGRVVDVNGKVIGMSDATRTVYDEEGKEIAWVVGPGDIIDWNPETGILNKVITDKGEVYTGARERLGNYNFEKDEWTDPHGTELDPSGVYLYDLEDRAIARLIGCELFTTDGQTKLGSLLSDGTIRDINNDLYGRAAPDNKVYNPDGTLKGEFRGAVDLRKCGLAGIGAGGSGQTISLPGLPSMKVENGSIIDPRTNRIIGYMGDNGRPYLFNPPSGSSLGEEDPRPIPQPHPPRPVPSEWRDQQQEILTNRRKSMSAQLSSGGTLKIPGPEVLAKAKKHQDADWGIGKSISTWPVDMSNMILKDKGIPAVLVHSIDTRYADVPVTAMVERHIYAEAGRNIIIPAGSRLIGSASGSSSAGEAKASKVTITWERLIRPDGAAFNFSATSADAQGRGGVAAYLDEQLFQKYANPFVTTIFTALTNKMVDLNDKSSKSSSSESSSGMDGQTYGQQTRQMFIDNFKDIFDTMLQEANDVQPVLFVPSGTRLIAYPQQDLWLRSVQDDEKDLKSQGYENSPNAKKPDIDSWVDKRTGSNSDSDTSNSNSNSGSDEPVYAPPSSSADSTGTNPYAEQDALPDELLERSMNPVTQGGVAEEKEVARRRMNNSI
ncbi:MAG: hypothetical protein J6Y85_00670 [Alphaproteobacteria bacterium]|nr:hypothetical protein [Alphaproteobacteria bacterium]